MAQLATALEAPEPVLNKFVSQDYLYSEVLAHEPIERDEPLFLADYLRDRGGKISSALVDDLATALMVEDARKKGDLRSGQVTGQPVIRQDRV